MQAHFKRKIPFYPLVTFIAFAFSNGGINGRGVSFFFVFLLRYIICEPFRLIEVFLYDGRIRNHRLIEDPIFILGHWRSGTSHLQNLLSKNSEHTTTSLFQFLFADTYLLTEAWLKKPLNWVVKFFRPHFSFQRLPMDFDLPGELDSAMCAMCSPYAYTWGHLFPKRFEKLTTRLLHIEDSAIAEKWIEDYDYLIRKLSFQKKTKRVIVKSPGDTSRVNILLRKYPNSKFIYLHRNPIDVFHSTRYLWDVIQKENSFQRISKEQIDKHIIQTYKLVLSKYIVDRQEIPSDQLIEISFNDLQKKPLVSLELIYTKLELGKFQVKDVEALLEKNKSYKTNLYTTSIELEEQLKTEWEFSFEEMPLKDFTMS